MSPTLSIIIPAYNVCEFIESTLESIQGQSCAPDEIIIIDDGSTDGTINKVNNFTFQSRLIVVSQENKGQGAARNLGTELATSDYLYFLDADDLIGPDFVETIKTVLNGFRFPDLLLFSGVVIGSNFSPYLRGITLSSTTPLNILWHLRDNNRSSSCSPCLYVVKRSFWINARLSFHSNYFEDETLFYPLILSSSSCCIADIALFFRRVRSGSTMTMKLNSRHIQGAIDGIRSTSFLLKQESSPLVQKMLMERMIFFIAKYLDMCVKIKQRPKYSNCLSASLPLPTQLKVFRLIIATEIIFLKSFIVRSCCLALRAIYEFIG